MKILPILAEHSWKSEIKLPPLCTTPHENLSQSQIPCHWLQKHLYPPPIFSYPRLNFKNCHVSISKETLWTSQATKTKLFARIVDVLKLMPWMVEGLWLNLWLVLTFSNPWEDKAVLTPLDVWTAKYCNYAGVCDSIWNSP